MTKIRKYPKPYRSKLEWELAQGPLSALCYAPADVKLKYTVKHTYTPDFIGLGGVLYEVKGRCRTSEEARKYIEVRKQHPGLRLRFILSNPNVRAYPQTQQSLGEWLTKYGFEWCRVDEIPNAWRRSL